MGGQTNHAPTTVVGSKSTTKHPPLHLPVVPLIQSNPVITRSEAHNHSVNNAVAGSNSTDEHPKIRLLTPHPLPTDPIAAPKKEAAMEGLRQQCTRIKQCRHLQALADDARKLADEKAAGVNKWLGGLPCPADGTIQDVSKVVGGARAKLDRDLSSSASTRAQPDEAQKPPNELLGILGGNTQEPALSKIVKDISDKRSERDVLQINEAGDKVQRTMNGHFSGLPAMPGPQTSKTTVGGSQRRRNKTRMYQFDESGVLRDMVLEAAKGSGNGELEVQSWGNLFEGSRPATTQDRTQNGNKPSRKQKLGIQSMIETLNAIPCTAAHREEINIMVAAHWDSLAAREPSTQRSKMSVGTDLTKDTNSDTLKNQTQNHTTPLTPQHRIEPAQKGKEKSAIQTTISALNVIQSIEAHWLRVNEMVKDLRDKVADKVEDDDWEIVEVGGCGEDMNGSGRRF